MGHVGLTHRIERIELFNPYLVGADELDDILQMMTNPLDINYQMLRDRLVINSMVNDFASLITQSPASIGVVHKYESYFDHYSSYINLSWLDLLSWNNHSINNWTLGNDIPYTHLQNGISTVGLSPTTDP